MDATSGDNGAVDMNDTMDNLQERIANLEMVFAYLKNKKMMKDRLANRTKWLQILTSSDFIDRRRNIPNLDHPAETGNWSLCWERLIYYNFAHFATLIYWNDAFHWLETKDRQLTLYKFHIDDHDHPIITTLEIPNGLHQGRNFLQSFIGGSYDPMLEQIDIPGILLMQGRLFESRGCLLLVCRDDIDSREFNIYEMMKACSMWMVSSGIFRLAIDPRKPLNYKVVQAGRASDETEIQIYSLETKGLNRELKRCKLNIEDHDHPIMTSLEISHGVHRGRNFLESFGGPSNDLILLLMELPHMLNLKGEFFESCGCLLLICRDDIGSTKFTIYEMMKESSVCSVRYVVNIEQSMNPLPEGWSIRTSVWSICLGEGEADAFVVLNLSGKVVKYNLISKTNTDVFDIGSNQMDDDDDDEVEFISPFEVDPNLYEFILSLASVL
nr:hypothetical protein [Tanacetum cinerariifolium]